ncbi:MAG: homoserine dehydrogenase [Longimicrobiales bacterium]
MKPTVVLRDLSDRPSDDAGVRTVRVALAGCGTVGGSLLRLLRERVDTIAGVHSLRFQVVRVLVHDVTKPRALPVPREVLTDDVDAFLATDTDICIEAIGGIEPAGRIVRHALSQARAVVTANKALIAEQGDALLALAGERDTTLAFEGSVAGGVPVIRVLQESLAQTGVTAIRGILNGTTNYILTRMDAGASFADALAEAQEKGFAEADPTRDLNGQDAADKIAILAWQAFGIAPGDVRVQRAGLLPDADALVRDARAAGGVVRLIAECSRDGDGVRASVAPVFVAQDSEFARLAAEENLVLFETESSGTIRLGGPGAGGGPTASAVLSDMVQAGRRIRRVQAVPVTVR